MKKNFKLSLALCLGFFFVVTSSNAQRRTYPTSISVSGGGTFCQYGAPSQITIPAMPSTTCGSGANATVSHTTTIYSNTVNSTVGGTPVATLTNTSLTTNASYTPPTSVCGTTYYYAEVTWAADGCAPAGTLTSSTVAVTVDCSCIAPSSNQTINTCGLTWYDSGGSGANYSNNETYTVTFCPSTPGEIIVVDFNSFDVQGAGGTCNDMMDIWQSALQGAPGSQDDRICGNMGAVRFVSTSPDGCITFEFRSDASTTRAGWAANVFCATPCTNPVAQLTDASIVNICPPTAVNAVPNSNTISVDASSSTAGAGFTLSSYIWEWGDGTTSTTNTPTTTHTYPSNSEIYVLKLRVADDNFDVNLSGCLSTNSVTKVIRILPEPDFTGTTSSPLSLNCGDNQNLVGVLGSQTQTEFVPDPIVGTTILPDGSGVPFESTIDFSGYFNPGATMAPGCYPTICFNIEHSFTQDLSIELVAPDGTSVIIFDEVQNGAMGVGASVFGSCVNSSDASPVVPGCGAEYCVVNSGGASWTGGAAVRTTAPATGSCSWTGACEATGAYYIPQAYNSSFSLSALNGVPLNGVWTLRITDNLAQDNGVLFGWSLNFPTSCYKNLETVTPSINTLTWSHTGTGPTLPAQNTTSTNVTDPGPDPCQVPGNCTGNELTNSLTVGAFNTAGSFDYLLTGVDQFGCQYDRTITINVTCPLNATLDGATSFCGSGSTNLTFSGTPNATVTYNINGGANQTIVLDAAGVAVLNTGMLSSTTNYNLVSVSDGVTTTTLSETETVTINPNPTADAPSNVTACDSYTLPALNVGNYFTATNGGGTALAAGNIITTTQTIFVFAQSGVCIDENSFTVTINPTPTFSIVGTDPTVCNASDGFITVTGLTNNTTYSVAYNYVGVTVGPANFTTDASGTFQITGLNAGSYDNFSISLNGCTGSDLVGVSLANPGAPDVNDIANQVLCSPSGFILPAITGTNLTGNEAYYTATNGGGSQIAVGTTISSTQTIFIYDVNGTCSDQENFTVTINMPPNAGVLSGNQAICVAGTTTFTSNGDAGGSWTSSDNAIATVDASGNITAVSAGTATITYTVNGIAPCGNATASLDVTVTASPDAGTLTGTQAICVAGTTTLSTNGNAGGSWTSSDASIASVDASGVVTGVAAGNATITYTVTGTGGCSDASSTINVSVSNPPNAGTLSGNQVICVSGTTTFINDGDAGGAWTSSDITIATVDASGNITAVSAGTATITYTVTGSGGCSNATATRTVTVTAAPNAGTLSGNQTICAAGSTTFTSNGDAGGSWTTSDASIATVDASGNITGVATGTATITYTVTGTGGCSDASSTRSVTVAPSPTVTTVSGGATYCPGDVIAQIQASVTGTAPWTISYTVNGNPQTAIGNSSPIDLGNTVGTFVVTSVVDGACSNTASGTQVISLNATPSVTSVTGGATYCPGDAVAPILAAVSGTGPWTIDFTLNGNAQSVTGNTSPINLGTTAGTYVVTNVQDALCSSVATGSQTITLNTQPTVGVVSGGNTYCQGDVVAPITATVTGSGPWTIDYTIDGVAQSATGATSPITLANTAGVYVVNAISDVNCANNATGTQTITINAIPTAPNVSNDTSYCSYESFSVMSATAAGTITWYGDNNLTSVLATTATLTPSNSTGATTYFVTQTVNGCESTPSSVVITVNECELIIPTAFTPDGDQTNDTWHIENLNAYFPNCNVTIYNRWGNKVFESTGYAKEWDGTFESKELPVASYYFIIDFNDGKTEKANGTVSIIKNK